MIETLYKASFLLLWIYLLCLFVVNVLLKKNEPISNKSAYRWISVLVVILIFIIIMTILKG